MQQKATKVRTASSTSWGWLNLPEKSRPANTKTFLIHSWGRPVLIAARSGERRGTTGSAAACPVGAGTVGCSEVIVSILMARRAEISRQPGDASRQGIAAGRRLPCLPGVGPNRDIPGRRPTSGGALLNDHQTDQ